VKRLAVEVEDHPMEYNTFEGTIPESEYGGGDVIVWDRGSYETVPPGQEIAMRQRGRIHVRFFGKKLEGEWYFIRTRPRGDKPQWLMFKADDEYADPDRDPVRDKVASVITRKKLPRDRVP
jgi:bifunctional non-homologous end joining protein LigD